MASGLNTQSNRTLRYDQRNHIKNISKQNSDRIMRLDRRNNSKQEISSEVKDEIIQLNKKDSKNSKNSNNNSMSAMSSMSSLSSMSSIRRTRSSGLIEHNDLF